MRRLRTLADKYYGQDPAKGRLRQVWGLLPKDERKGGMRRFASCAQALELSLLATAGLARVPAGGGALTAAWCLPPQLAAPPTARPPPPPFTLEQPPPLPRTPNPPPRPAPLQIIDETFGRIRGAAARDNAVWARGDGTRGYAQLTTEFIPIRCAASCHDSLFEKRSVAMRTGAPPAAKLPFEPMLQVYAPAASDA